MDNEIRSAMQSAHSRAASRISFYSPSKYTDVYEGDFQTFLNSEKLPIGNKDIDAPSVLLIAIAYADAHPTKKVALIFPKDDESREAFNVWYSCEFKGMFKHGMSHERVGDFHKQENLYIGNVGGTTGDESIVFDVVFLADSKQERTLTHKEAIGRFFNTKKQEQ